MTSKHSKRAYGKALTDFFAWMRTTYIENEGPSFTKSFDQEYRTALLERRRSALTISRRLAAVRKLARELADNGRLDPSVAAPIERAKGVERRGVRAGNWLIKEQVNELLQAPSASTRKGKRDRPSWRCSLPVVCGGER